jgi:hypothetical protein
MGSRPAGSSWPPTGLFHGSAYASNEKASCTHHTHFIYVSVSLIKKKSGLRIRIRINLSCRIRIQEGKNDPQKKKKVPGKEISCFELLEGLF